MAYEPEVTALWSAVAALVVAVFACVYAELAYAPETPTMVEIVVAKLGSSPKAAANSFSVSSVVGAEFTRFAIALFVYVIALLAAIKALLAYEPALTAFWSAVAALVVAVLA